MSQDTQHGPNHGTRRDAVIRAIQNDDREALSSLLAEEPSLAAARDGWGVSALMLALYHREPELAALLREHRESVDLFEAASLGEVEAVVEHLAEEPQAVGALSPDGFTALHLAAFFDRPPVVSALLARDAAVDRPADNPSGVYPVHSAVAGGSAGSLVQLLEAGASVDVRQQGGFTPLMGAAAAGRRDLVEILLDADADVTLEDHQGKTARAHAEERDQTEVLELLDSRGDAPA